MDKKSKKGISKLLAIFVLLATVFGSLGIKGTFASDAVINIYVAGDSTVKSYTTADVTGGWGEYLQKFFNSNNVKIANYANGGRSSRSFINEGSLQKIASAIKKGDYLLIQFGHNDCANSSNYLIERFVSLGVADSSGIYPSTPAVKVATPADLTARYGAQFYPYTSGTYKWYLQQYIDTAKKVGATPILVTPVSRQYFNSNGTIKPHHDATDKTTGTVVTSNNAYVTAVKQLGQEQGVKVIDMFTITKDLFEKAYKDDPSAGNGTSAYAKALMQEATHCNKLGGFYEGGLIAKEIQKLGYDISQNVILPTNVRGISNSNLLFEVDSNSKVSVYSANASGTYTSQLDTYWIQKSQTLINSLNAITSTKIPTATPSKIATPTTNMPTNTAAKDSTIYQAENATCNQAVIETKNAGYTGTGYINYDPVVGSYIEWMVNVPASGNVRLNFRFANGATSNRPVEIKVNGATLASSMDFNPTGSWTTWNVNSADTLLNKGSNIIRATSLGTEGPNIDYVEVVEMKSTTPMPTDYVSPDLNGDGVINMGDVIILATSFNTVRGDAQYVESRDLNKDGAINMSDVLIIAAKFNTSI